MSFLFPKVHQATRTFFGEYEFCVGGSAPRDYAMQ